MWGDASEAGARILVVDDEEANVRLLERALGQAGYRNVWSTTDPRRASGLVAEFKPDLILLDLLMPHLDGFEVMRSLELFLPGGSYIPVLVLTGDVTRETRQRALASGANDFLTKPFDIDEVLVRIRNMLEIKLLHEQLRDRNEALEHHVRTRTRELEEAQIETFERLALAAEYRDDSTGQHTRRVGRTAALVAGQLGLPEGELELIERAAGLHDVGKIGVPDGILPARRRLTPKEFDVVKTHTAIGARILSGSRSPLLRLAEEIALTHHERWDGAGYAALAGEEIPLSARITSVADVFDALTHERPYKQPWTVEAAIAWIESQRGGQFDPAVVDAFLHVHEDVSALALDRGSAA